MPRKTSRLVVLTAIALILLYVVHSVSRSPKPHPPETRPGPAPVDPIGAVHQFYPPESIKPLPTGKPYPFPSVQAPATAFSRSAQNEERRNAVRNVFKRSYDAYKKHAWMHDELKPVSGGYGDPFGGWAATLVDSLDTLWIMDYKAEFARAVEAVTAIKWADTSDGAANLFETTIRHLGGLLSAYDLSGDEALLRKATELGEMLYTGFDTPNRLPGFWLNYASAKKGDQRAGTADPSSAIASMSMEFTRLAQLTNDSKFYDATDRVSQFLDKIQAETNLPGMWPITMNFRSEMAAGNAFTLGALADSLYEYLPKMHILMGGLDEKYEKMYRMAADVIVKYLLFRPMTPDQADVLFTGDVKIDKTATLNPQSQHLTCFVGGMFALGGQIFGIDEHVSIGERLARGCGWAYASFPTGVMPEIFDLVACPTLQPCEWDEKRWKDESGGSSDLPKGFRNIRDKRYILRPEAIESIFVLYRVTGNADLRDLAWEMFESIMKATETELANSAIKDVTARGKTSKTNSMEVSLRVSASLDCHGDRVTDVLPAQSFWMAETLKYFYLIFSPPDLISLDEYVLNTEAHPLRRPR